MGRIKNVTDGKKKFEYNGIYYRSKLEKDTAMVFDKLGIAFEYEPIKFEVFKGFRCRYQKEKVIAVTYTPDFVVGDILWECKGMATPEWNIKKKLLFRYLEENNLDYTFIQTRDARKSLLEALDNLWLKLGFAISVTPKPKARVQSVTRTFSSVREAMEELGLWKPIGSILRSLTGKTRYVYGYEWKLTRIKI